MHVSVHVGVYVCVCVGRKNSSTLGSFPGSHQGWNNAGLTSTGFAESLHHAEGVKCQVLHGYLYTCTYGNIGNVQH